MGITKPLRPLFPISGDDPALISFYFGNDDENPTPKGAKEQPDEPAVVSIPWRSLQDRTGLIDRERGLLECESPFQRASFDMRGVVEGVRHRVALVLRFALAFELFSIVARRLNGVSPYQIQLISL
jgi:hypothetical protein